MVKKYRKRPVVIEALEWTGQNEEEINKFIPPHIRVYETDGLYIVTLEGNHFATKGDFIIKGVAGEFYPCKPDIFAKTYEPVEEEAADAA